MSDLQSLKVDLPNNESDTVNIFDISKELERLASNTSAQIIQNENQFNEINKRMQLIIDVLDNHKQLLDKLSDALFRGN